MSTRMDQKQTDRGPRLPQNQNYVGGWIVAAVIIVLVLWWIAAMNAGHRATTYVPGNSNSVATPDSGMPGGAATGPSGTGVTRGTNGTSGANGMNGTTPGTTDGGTTGTTLGTTGGGNNP
jgi:hypothetical protein